MYRQIYDQLLLLRSPNPGRPSTPSSSGLSNGTCSDISLEIGPPWETLNQWTRLLLLINPDLTLGWNVRKELLASSRIDPANELRFTELILTFKPKTSNIFSHRQWILRQFYPTSSTNTNVIDANSHNQESTSTPTNQTANIQDIIQNEFRVCLDAASRYGRNYYAWSHRVWVVRRYCSLSNIYVIHTDLTVTRNWMESHVSDYSIYSYRQFLVQFLIAIYNSNQSSSLSSNKVLRKVFDDEMNLINSLLHLYRDQEALFLHRRFLLSISVQLWPETEESLRQSEMNFIDNHFSDSIRQSVKNDWQLTLMTRHSKFLERVLRWQLD